MPTLETMIAQPRSHLALKTWEKLGLWALALVLLGQGLNVVNRSVFLARRHTDLGVYLRAAWAAQTGRDLYSVTDNGCHYVYPPVLAIVLTPLAEPPRDGTESPAVPFLVSTVLWYLLSLACALWAIQLLANALEKASPNPKRDKQAACRYEDQPVGSRRWWGLRVIPFVVCLPPILGTLVHGQTNLILLLLLAGSITATLRGNSVLGGLCLAGAICLKVFPGFLVLYPLWRRDYRFLAGCALGLLFLLVILPILYWGPERTWQQHRRFAEVVLMPGLGTGKDRTVAKELTEVTATDSQSLQAVFHKTRYFDPHNRPRQVSSSVRFWAMLVGGLLTIVTLLSAGRRRNRPATEEMLFFGALAVNMLLLCPVTHLPYFVLLLPLVVALVDRCWPRQPVGRISNPSYSGLHVLLAVLGINIVARIVPHIPGLIVCRDLGVSMYAAVLLWLVAVVVAARQAPVFVPWPGFAEFFRRLSYFRVSAQSPFSEPGGARPPKSLPGASR